jgi:hypothetical protein
MLSLGLTAFGVLVVALPLTANIYFSSRLARRIAAYRAAGQPIEPGDFRQSPVPDELNRAIALAPLMDAIPDDLPVLSDLPYGFERAAHLALSSGVCVPDGELDAALSRPLVRWPHELPQIMGSGDLDLSRPRRLANYLACDARLAMEDRDEAAASRKISQMLRLAESEGTDTAYIGWLVSAGIEAETCDVILDSGLGANSKLAKPLIARLLDETGERQRLSDAMLAERAGQLRTFRSMAASSGRVKGWVVGTYADVSLIGVFDLADLQRELMLEEDPTKIDGIKARINALGSSRINVVTWTLASSAFRSDETPRRARADRRLAAVVLALRAYRADRGVLPEKLEELVPEYLPAIPVDPFACPSAPLRYIRATGVVYSVGKNGIDDGGDITPPRPKDEDWAPVPWQAKDYGFRVDPLTKPPPRSASGRPRPSASP